MTQTETPKNTNEVKTKFLKLITLIISILISYRLFLFISEKYFFNELFYQKSNSYGYRFEEREKFSEKVADLLLKRKDKNNIKKRGEDLDSLINQSVNDEENILDKEIDEGYKIAVIGDSYVFGVGIKERERFPVLLEKKLNEITPTKVYILGESWDSILDHYAKYLLAEKHLDIDLYIFHIVDNDLLLGELDKYPNKKSIFDELKRNCPGEAFFYDESLSFDEMHLKSFSKDYANLCLLSEIIKKMAKDNVVFFPTSVVPSLAQLGNDRSSEKYVWSYTMNTYLDRIKEGGGNILSPNSLENFIYEPVSSIEVHASLRTHRLYAELLFKEITENSTFDFPHKVD